MLLRLLRETVGKIVPLDGKEMQFHAFRLARQVEPQQVTSTPCAFMQVKG